VVDTIGLLSKLYHYGDCAYIGGGFDEGIHNTLEPAVFGNPVAF
jgi:3-deoxy-D-manno-octulosonic-acid transferase